MRCCLLEALQRPTLAGRWGRVQAAPESQNPGCHQAWEPLGRSLLLPPSEVKAQEAVLGRMLCPTCAQPTKGLPAEKGHGGEQGLGSGMGKADGQGDVGRISSLSLPPAAATASCPERGRPVGTCHPLAGPAPHLQAQELPLPEGSHTAPRLSPRSAGLENPASSSLREPSSSTPVQPGNTQRDLRPRGRPRTCAERGQSRHGAPRG